MYKATVTIKLKKGVLNPEGRTVLRALNFLGYNEVKDAKTFKKVELLIEGDNESEILNKVDEMCKKLLANPVIHDYEIELEKVE
ncbi:MAG: phosphoribosylformylglycinamidine synthase subunit PurS [Methanothermococcus sp.]|jgi:phosphoribosylformylglycinamidine synthase|uniref:phosphoribosylformylglycinamidine synthase subunit PurS n=1 Tax=Methanothermococcus TaxID=155862 RepID=UPI000365B18B|nr:MULTISPECIES: phosphoribosylformylglycinamidine synthase subunit PurS [Methanothermococcus]MDK2790964.1 phosphoribosylformylglycinamidine synthase subunit PurS [Methanothermococcus sp.]MDK2988197.1 phosphoribosylformylglycinamidine synthase subunit PurS [Methanothermococcus sp.]